ncbi:MAG TPA: GAF domain-containing protein, partial [Nitrososphaeraceae archaeon]|nr:GAF domain-containing protein [Nitrososphaeraceae archaeon]
LDEIDKMMLSYLGKNARISSREIERNLQDIGYKITERAVRYRIRKLETSNTVLGYSTILNPSFVSQRVNRTVILKFKYSYNASTLIDRLENYVQEASFCVYSARLSGDFDWICHFVFDSIEQYELESNNFLHRFADLIADFRSYESKPAKVSTYSVSDEHDMVERKSRVFKILNSLQKYNNLNDKLRFIVESVVKYFDAKFARIWLVDKERKYLILKFSAGKYKNIQGEFSKVPLDSNKIGPIVKTKKPTISNDVVNDPRIRYPEWAKKERLKSFAGYPLMSKGQPIGVLGMFSEKKLSPADFEILRVFCDQISNELASFLSAAEFLSIK